MIPMPDLSTQNTSVSTPNSRVRIFRFLMELFAGAQLINQSKKESKDNFSITYLVSKVHELAFSIVRMCYKSGTLQYETQTPIGLYISAETDTFFFSSHAKSQKFFTFISLKSLVRVVFLWSIFKISFS